MIIIEWVIEAPRQSLKKESCTHPPHQLQDSIDHDFMDSALKVLGFGKYIREWIRLFFNDREAYILLGGHITEKIHLQQGVPQGDVISPYVFILIKIN